MIGIEPFYVFQREGSHQLIPVSKEDFDAGVQDRSISRFDIGRSVSKEAQQEYLNDAGYGGYDYDYIKDNADDFDQQIALREMKMMRKYLHSIQKRK